ncbi:hypothetical protein CTAM01_17228 [Colletotrichum tamarilloi]|uniref:Secreted protein n=1 Tax=Colletotrichum tamarilloi TaxID=1209934 RepID=A0ABQ9QG86_9PEZI|nr:uncharacterized protein CTAM01_17228 [Colletotrichum tamarilloi]KAK1456020.1 hypothetical protein CTAM01_17228 [Colletotrichum tamarilloi]
MSHRVRLAGWLAGVAPPTIVLFLRTAAQKSRRQPRSSSPLLPRPDPPAARDRPRLAQSEQGRQSKPYASAAMYAPVCRLHLSSDGKFDRGALFPRNRPGRLARLNLLPWPILRSKEGLRKACITLIFGEHPRHSAYVRSLRNWYTSASWPP